jgi:tetratricopeptide (TPR) repeat protein
MKYGVVIALSLMLGMGSQIVAAAQPTPSCTDEAIARENFEVSPDGINMLGLGLSLACHGKLDEAITLFRQVIQKYPDIAAGFDVYADLGHALKRQGKTEEAIAAYRTAIKHHADPQSGVYPALSELLKQQGKTKEAEAILKSMPEFDPEGGI